MFKGVTWLVTRRCGVGCKYCKFTVCDVEEAKLHQRIAALETIRSWPGNPRFVVLLGGDVLWMKDRRAFLEQLNGMGMLYGWATSTADARRMREDISDLRNLSISVDPEGDEVSDAGRELKARCGLYWAGQMRGIDPSVDIHATVTIDGDNLSGASRTIRMLTDLGIWTEITFVHWKVSPAYDLVPKFSDASPLTDGDLSALDRLAEEVIGMKRGGAKIHSSEAFIRAWERYAIALNWYCTYPSNAVVDADLSMRLCLHLPGRRVRRWRIVDIKGEEEFEEFRKVWDLDRAEYCKGCFWDCQFEAELDGKGAWYRHGG